MQKNFKYLQRTLTVSMIFFAGFFLTKAFFNPNPYILHFQYQSAEGIHQGSHVFLKGVKIGYISHIELDPNTYDVHFTIKFNNKKIIIYDNFVLRINKNLVLGKISLNIEIAPVDANNIEEHALCSGDTIPIVRGTVIETVFNDIKPLVINYLQKHQELIPGDLKEAVNFFLKIESKNSL
jgi:ABC-type transporter Mla subunit MlaD